MPAPTHVATASTTFSGSGTSFGFNTPSGAGAGNLLVATFVYQTPTTSDVANTLPAGWTSADGTGGTFDAGASQAVHIVVATKTATGGAETHTWTTASSVSDAVLSVSAYQDANTSSPWDVTGYSTQGASSTSMLSASITPTVVNGMLYGAVGNRININADSVSGTPTPTIRASSITANGGTAGTTPGSEASTADTSGSSVSTTAKQWTWTLGTATTTAVAFLGVLKAAGVTGSATSTITASTTADGDVVSGSGSATSTIAASTTAAGFLGAAGSATSTITASTTTGGSYGAVAAATQAITASATAAGDIQAPAFPLSPLPITVQLFIDNAWEDITEYVYGRDTTPVQITRGRTAEGNTIERQTCTLELNNRDGRFSPRNPLSPYYGKIGRNTLLGVTVNEGGAYLALTAGTTQHASTPDSPGLSVTGDLDLRVDLYCTDWTVDGDLVGKYDYISELSYLLWVDLGFLTLWWYDGSVTQVRACDVPLPAGTVGRLAVRATLDVDDGAGGSVVTFYYASTMDGPWRQLGGPMLGASTSVADSAAPLAIGDVGANCLPGRYFSAQVRDGIDGTLVANPIFSEQIPGADVFFDSIPNTWTLNNGAALKDLHARFVGEVSEWPQKWDLTGTDAWVPITASGQSRRLGQGQAPVQSTFRRSIPGLAALVAYWPLEDGQYADTVASGLPGGTPMTVTGTARFASNSGFPCSAPLPAIGTAKLDATVPAYTATGQTQIRFLIQVPESGTTDLAVIARWWTTGTAARWDLVYGVTDGGSLELRAYSGSGSSILTSGFTDFDMDGQLFWVAVELTQNGANIDWSVGSLRVGESSGGVASGTLSSRTVGAVTRISMNANQLLGDTALGHVTVEKDVTSIFDLFTQLNAYRGEKAGTRLQRLCDENGVALQTVGDPTDTHRMGYQLVKTFLDLAKECADTDGGILYEPRNTTGIAYRTRASLQRQNPMLSLSYPGHQMQELAPTEDDRYLRNDVTVARASGGSARATLTEGPLSTAAAPDGVGRYDTSVTLSLENDQDAEQQAYWRLHLGTVDEARYPTLRVDLAASAFTADQGLVRDVLSMDVGDRLEVTDPPVWVPPDPITQLVQGYTERLGQFTHEITWNLTPESPYRVGIYDDTESRYSSDGSQLNGAHNSSTTSLSVETASGPVWSDDDGAFDIMVGGERMTVTAISGTSSPQTFTVTRSVNGIVKSHADGTGVELFSPVYYDMGFNRSGQA